MKAFGPERPPVPAAPGLPRIATALADRPPVLIADPALAQAAVALVLAGPAEALSFLLVERARFDGDPWSGHLALPGGRMRPDDADLRATAERETREEVGLDLNAASYLGRHDDLHGTVQPIVVATHVYRMGEAAGARAQHEIEDVLWCPLARLYEPARQETMRITWRERALDLPAVRVLDVRGRPLLWGLTYRLLETLCARAGAPLPQASPAREDVRGDAPREGA